MPSPSPKRSPTAPAASAAGSNRQVRRPSSQPLKASRPAPRHSVPSTCESRTGAGTAPATNAAGAK